MQRQGQGQGLTSLCGGDEKLSRTEFLIIGVSWLTVSQQLYTTRFRCGQCPRH